MNYLGIGLETDKVVWSVVKNDKGGFNMNCGVEPILENQTAQQQAYYVYNFIYNLIKQYNIDFVINKWVNLNTYKKHNAFDLIRLKEKLLIACGKTNAIFIEPDTYGWEIYLAEKSKTKNKLAIIYKAYNIYLPNLFPNHTNKTYTDLANTIIITEAVALGRISGENKLKTDYKYKIKVGD